MSSSSSLSAAEVEALRRQKEEIDRKLAEHSRREREQGADRASETSNDEHVKVARSSRQPSRAAARSRRTETSENQEGRRLKKRSGSSRPSGKNNGKKKKKNVTATFEEILRVDVNERRVEVKWSNGEASWLENPVETFNGSDSLEALLKHLQDQMETDPGQEMLEEWIMDLESVVSAWKIFEEEDTPELHEIGFCCAHCKCPEGKGANRFVHSGEGGIWHRWCCHNISHVPEDWKTPLERTLENALKRCEKGEQPEPDIMVYNEQELMGRAKQAQKEEETIRVKLRDEEKGGDPVFVLKTNQKYKDLCRVFDAAVRRKEKREAVVLDVFAGVGTGLIVLKRLGIAMKKVIHVEHDLVATHVARYNHDNKYNTNLGPDWIDSDGNEQSIEHIFDYRSFEDLEERFDEFMEKHGPIDFVIGGPPCQDFSLVNAARQGIDGDDGKYFPRFGELIREKIGTHTVQDSRPVFFLAENVPVKGFDDEARVEQAFGITPLTVDAHFFSPCKRFRGYYMNLPVKNIKFNDTFESESCADVCLEDGWQMPAGVMADKQHLTFHKANTFMASKSRLDDIPRMLKVKKIDGGDYLEGTFSVLERERMLGYPEGYVERAVDTLFKELMNALGIQRQEDTPWTLALDEKYHCFSGEQVCFGEKDFSVFPELAPPTTNKTKTFFAASDYAKHLLGNAYSVPTVEHLLKPLTALFECIQYEGYDYKYKWPTVETVLEDYGMLATPVSESVSDSEPSGESLTMHETGDAIIQESDSSSDDELFPKARVCATKIEITQEHESNQECEYCVPPKEENGIKDDDNEAGEDHESSLRSSFPREVDPLATTTVHEQVKTEYV